MIVIQNGRYVWEMLNCVRWNAADGPVRISFIDSTGTVEKDLSALVLQIYEENCERTELPNPRFALPHNLALIPINFDDYSLSLLRRDFRQRSSRFEQWGNLEGLDRRRNSRNTRIGRGREHYLRWRRYCIR